MTRCRSLAGIWFLAALISPCPAPAETPGQDKPPTAIDLRPDFQRLGFGQRLQGNRPTCSVFTVTSAIEFELGRRSGHCPRLSVEFLNWAANQQGEGRADGGFFSDLWRGFATHGLCSEEEMPYQAQFDPARQPSAEAAAEARKRLAFNLRLHWIKRWDVTTGLSDGEFAALKATLANGRPVCGGFRWPKAEQWIDQVLQMCPPSAVFDGHSVLLVGYRDDPSQPGGGTFIFRNTSGKGRDGMMPYLYARTYMNDAAWVGSKDPPPR